MNRPTLSVDFDGVLHSYSSGWKGARVIADPPVPGAIEWLCMMSAHYEIAISSARSGQWGGRRAMRLWIGRQAERMFIDSAWEAIEPLMRALDHHTGMDPIEEEARDFARSLLKRIRFPRTKPSAVLYIDDRAHCFTGTFPTVEQIKAFKPWNKP